MGAVAASSSVSHPRSSNPDMRLSRIRLSDWLHAKPLDVPHVQPLDPPVGRQAGGVAECSRP